MRSGRIAALRTAAFLAVGFVVLRVVYRIIFGGGSGGGVLLLDLPRVPLAGPFRYIVLLGPITSGGLWNAVLIALPFAVLVLAFGLLSVIVDLRALLTRGALRGPVRTVSRALVVAWSTFPALRDSVMRVRVARELRGERGAASLIVPVLEHTVERALALGASMEVRGFAANRQIAPGDGGTVSMRAAALGFDGRWILESVDLECAAGSLVLVVGPTGAGKSTLLDAMTGLFQHFESGDQEGLIRVGSVDRRTTPPRETAGFVSAVAQSVRLSFVASTVDEEIGFALAVRGMPAAVVRERVHETAATLHISHLLDRGVEQLSAGEACLVAIGAALVSHPRLLIVDEPLADLDTAARERVVTALDALAHRDGVCVVVAEHATREWDRVADVRIEVAGGRVRQVVTLPSSPLPPRSAAPTDGPDVAAVRRLTVAHDGASVVDDASFTLRGGEFVALRGPNGAGKSSLLDAMARPRSRGTIEVAGVDVHATRPRARRSLIALVPEASDDLLFTTSVAAECRRTDRRAGVRTTAETFLRFVSGGAALLAQHPRDLSAGERLCLVIAIQLSGAPKVLLVDEPTRGLDAAARELVGSAVAQAAGSGAAVMVATHDADFAARFATRTLEMTAGRLTTPSVVAS